MSNELKAAQAELDRACQVKVDLKRKQRDGLSDLKALHAKALAEASRLVSRATARIGSIQKAAAQAAAMKRAEEANTEPDDDAPEA